ncbi:MAG: PQQ-binding-like beta-propeller repeat protein, partial [Methanomicrobia archaeon]|nr:PQQ-binding-like beta-propeller repeat protein [Methanomicrobia archaeon]
MITSSLAGSDCDGGGVRLNAFVLEGAIVLLLLAAAMPTMAAAETGDGYPMFHYDLQRTGNVSGDAPMTDDLLWSTDLGGFVESSPTVANGCVYASNWEMGVGSYGLHCLDERTGTIRWNNSLYGGDGGASTAALFGDDKLVVGSKSGYLYCINATSGETRWSKKIEHDPLFWGVASSPVVYDAEDLIFVTTFSNNSLNNGTLHVFDFNGTEVWSLSTGDTFYYTSPAIADGKVYFAGHLTTHSLFCVDISSRTIEWQFNTSTQIKSTPAIWNDTVFFATADSMYAVDARTGGEVWSNPFSCVMSSPAISNGKVYIGSEDDKKLYCYDGSTGVELWNYTVDGVIQSSPVVARETVFFGTSVLGGAVGDGTIYALNATDGSLRWSYGVDQCVMSSPAVADGILFIGADDGSVYAFGENPAITTNVRIEGKNETIWHGDVTFSNSTIVDTDSVSHHLDKPTALGAVDAASKLGNFSYEVENQTEELLVKSLCGEANNPETGDRWLYRVDYCSPTVGAADFVVGVTEPPSTPHREILWYYGSSAADPLDVTLEKTSVAVDEFFNVTVRYYNDTTNGWEPLDNATVHAGTENYTTGSDGNATLSLSRAGSYTVYAEKEGFVRSVKRTVRVSFPLITVRIEGQNETIWCGDVTLSNSTIVDTANVSHYFDKPTALGVLDAALKLGNFSYEVEDMGWGLLVTSIGGEAYNPITWDPSWLYRVDYYSPMVGAADFIVGVTEPPSVPHKEVLWYLGSFTAAPLAITLDKTKVTAGEPFNVTVTYYNDTTNGWKPLDNATVYAGAVNYTTGSNGNATLSLSRAGSYTVYAEKEGFVRSLKRNVSVSLPCITVRIEGQNETVWYGDVIVGTSTIVDTANVSHYFDKPTALGALDAASKLGNFSYKVVDMGWGLMVTSIGGEAYNP